MKGSSGGREGTPWEQFQKYPKQDLVADGRGWGTDGWWPLWQVRWGSLMEGSFWRPLIQWFHFYQSVPQKLELWALQCTKHSYVSSRSWIPGDRASKILPGEDYLLRIQCLGCLKKKRKEKKKHDYVSICLPSCRCYIANGRKFSAGRSPCILQI